MWDTEPRKVLVGVESACCEAALQYAAAEARRRGSGIHLAHVARPAVMAACALDDLALVEDELRLVGEAALACAARRLEELVRDDERISVSTELTHGSTVHSLAALSAHAAVAVLQHEGMGESGESATLSVTAGVAAHGHCPVVAVPSGWRPGVDHGCVVVGVGAPTLSREVARSALAEAARRNARLVLVHAWSPGRTASPETAAAGSARRHAVLSEAFADLCASRPEVHTEVVVGVGSAASALLEQSVDADLVVVGRHHRGNSFAGPVGGSVGASVRALLRGSSTPVMVVDPLPGPGQPFHVDLATVAIP